MFKNIEIMVALKSLQQMIGISDASEQSRHPFRRSLKARIISNVLQKNIEFSCLTWIASKDKSWLPGNYESHEDPELTGAGARLALRSPITVALPASEPTATHTLPAALPLEAFADGQSGFVSIALTGETRLLFESVNNYLSCGLWSIPTHPSPLHATHLLRPTPPHIWHILSDDVFGTSICETWFWKSAVGLALMSHTSGISVVVWLSSGAPK